MAVSVQKYIKNMGKSVAYSTADVLTKKFDYIRDFKNENREMATEVYSSIKNYKTSFNRIKKVITNNKVMDAARIGYDSIIYSISTGDFYAKNKENEIIEKYGGDIFNDYDIDDEDFNWEDENLSSGDKVIATAIKKNNKIGTALTVEAISQTGKAQMNVSKENTMLIYTQNERMMSKLDSGFSSLLGFLKQNEDQTIKIQNQMNDNLNKFMTNVDNNVNKLTKQMDELLEMQRNIYKPEKNKNTSRQTNYNNIINMNGVLNIKEYLKHVKKQAYNEANEKFGGALDLLLGNSIDGSNIMATVMPTIFRSALSNGINKVLGKNFDNATKQLDNTLKGIVPSIISKLNGMSKQDDSGIMGFLGRIFGIREKTEKINTSEYKKGAIPFDGITKRAITDVIPAYLRKILSTLTGGVEKIYDYQSGKWTNMKDLRNKYEINSNLAIDNTANKIITILESHMNGRRLNNSFKDKYDYDEFMEAVKSYAKRLQNVGNFGSIKEDDLYGTKELEVHKALKYVNRLNNDEGKDIRYTTNSKGQKIKSGLKGNQLSDLNLAIRQFKEAQNSVIRQINEGESILRTIEAEGLNNISNKSYFGKDINSVNSYGDLTQEYIQNTPFTQSLIKGKDEYGHTLYDYLRDMGSSLKYIKANSLLSFNTPEKFTLDDWERIFNNNDGIKYNTETKDIQYAKAYFQHQIQKNIESENENYNRRINSYKDEANRKGENFPLATSSNFNNNSNEIDLMKIITNGERKISYNAITKEIEDRKESENEKWKKIESIFGTENTKKLRKASDEFDKELSLPKNMEKVKNKGFTANLMIFTKWINEKLGKPRDAVTDSVLKIDYWLQKLLYGEDLKEDEKKKGFFERIKDSIETGFKNIENKLQEAFDKFKEKVKPYKEKYLDPFITKIFGKKNDDGIRSGGLFGNFIGGVQKSIRKNGKDLMDYTKSNVKSVTNKVRNIFHSNTNSQKESPIKTKHNISGLDKNTIEKLNNLEKEQNKDIVINDIIHQNNNNIAKPYNLIQNEIIAKNKKFNNIRKMAVGGVNRTGRAFHSVLSAGEYLNGKLVPKTGIYTVPKGGVVVNPADSATRSKQARNERNFLRNIKKNAETNDGLTSEPNNEDDHHNQQEEKKKNNKIIELMTNTDWTELSDKKQKAEFIGNVVGRGLIGGGLGLLVGGPLLGASIGAASSLTKSTGAFSSLLFGEAIKKDGKVQVDENGNIIRQDNGLITKEMMKAVPDMKKFGLGGALAGLITPIGPLGGLLTGAALGFAKNAEIFQGSLFGEGGIFSDKNINKLKKGAKNMGAGAIIGSLMLPGPFGILGKALIGATAGYVTSTDKFKDALLGEKIDPNNPNSKREGGVIGTIKSTLKPLKSFATNLRDNIMDEIFGKDKGNGREGGLFGAIKNNMVNPIIEGTKSAFQSLSNKISDIANFVGDSYKKFRAKHAGKKDFIGRLMEGAEKVSSGLVHGAGAIGRGLTKPFRLLGEDGIGGMLTGGRIKKGQEYGKTARERLMFRTKHKLGDDKFYESDQAMADMSKDDLMMVQTLLNYNKGQSSIDQTIDSSYTSFGQGLRNYLKHSDANKVINMVRNNDYAQAERFVKTRKISDESKTQVLNLIYLQKQKLGKYKNYTEQIKNAGGDVQKLLSARGLNIDINDPKAMRYLKKQIGREVTHREAGLTNDEIEFDKEREFWTDKEKSPLKTVNTGMQQIVNTINNIYDQIKYDNEYNSLSKEEKAKYSSREEYIATQIKNNQQRKDNLEENKKQSQIKSVSSNINKKEKNLYQKFNDIQDKKKFKMMSEIADRGVRIFNNIITTELSNPEKVKIDIDEYETDSQNGEKYEAGKKLTREIIINRFNKTYKFNIEYTCTNKGDIKLCEKQSSDFENNRNNFISEYMQSYMPKDSFLDKLPSLTFGDIIKKSVKAAGILSIASVIPGGLLTIIGLKLAKKYDLKGKAVKGIKKASARVKYHLGSHEINMESKLQKHRERKYSIKAEKALDKAIQNNDPKLNDIATEKYNLNYDELTNEQRVVVNNEFMSRYKKNKMTRQILGHGVIGNIKTAAGTVKSGIKNTIAGGIDKVRAKKEKAQEENRFLGKLFNHLDKWKIKKEKQEVIGKKDSRLAKVLKWLFVGGIATPIIVGFIKDKVMPAIHEKVQPWLKKAKDKLIGVKNIQTGEYEGGIVSGIVNPIRNFFKDKFQTVSDWFHNTGKFNNPNSGFKGLIGNIKGAGLYLIDLWKSGTSTIINEAIPRLTEGLVVNFKSISLAIVRGIWNGFKDLFFGDKKYDGSQDLDNIGSGTLGSKDGVKVVTTTKYGFNNTVGGTIAVPTPEAVRLGWDLVDYSSNVDIKTNEDGTQSATNKYGEQVSSQKIDDEEMRYYGTNESDQKLYMRRDGSDTKTYVKNPDGTYSPYAELQNVFDEGLYGDTDYDESIKDYDRSAKQANEEEVNYYNDTGIKTAKDRWVQALFQAIFNKKKTRANNLVGAGKLFKRVGKGFNTIGKGFSHMGVPGKLASIPTKGIGKIWSGIGRGASALGNFASTGNDLFHIWGDHIDSKFKRQVNESATSYAARKYSTDIGAKAAKEAAEMDGNLYSKFKSYFKNKNILKKASSAIDDTDIYKNTFKAAKDSGLKRKEAKILAGKAEEKAADIFREKYQDAINKGFSKKMAKKMASKAITDATDDIAKETLEGTLKKEAKNVGKDIIENTMQKGAKNAGKDAIKDTLQKGAKNVAKDVLEDATKPSSAKHFKDLILKFPKKLVEMLTALFNNKIFQKLVGDKAVEKFFSKSGQKMLTQSSEDLCKELAETTAKKGTMAGAKAAYSTALSVGNTIPLVNIVTIAITAVTIIADAISGFNNAGNILMINNKKLTLTDKLLAAFIKAWQSGACALPSPVGQIFTFIFLIISEQTAATITIFAFNKLVNFITGEDSDIQKRRDQSIKEYQQFNQENNTNLSFEQWNNRKNATTYTKIKNSVSNAGWSLLGKDRQSTEDLKAGKYYISAGSDLVQKIKDKLCDMIGYMWKHKSKKIRQAKEITRDQFINTCTKVIDKIVILLNGVKDNSKLKEVYANVKAHTGPVDWWRKCEKPFNNEWDNPLEYLKLPEGTEETLTIKCIAAISSVFAKACGGADLKWKIISIIITEFGDLFRAVDDEQMKQIIKDENEKIKDVNEEYNSAANITDEDLLIDSSSGTNETDNSTSLFQDISSNANANDKLSPLDKTNILYSPLEKIGMDIVNSINKIYNKLFGDTKTLSSNNDKTITSNTNNSGFIDIFTKAINQSIGKVTNETDNIESIFSNLDQKNKTVNDAIDSLSILPSNKKYWEIELDNSNPFVSSLYNFMESMNRVVKAPFSLTAATLGNGLEIVSNSATSNSNQTNDNTDSSNKNNDFLDKLSKKSSKSSSKFLNIWKNVFGKGKEDSNSGYGNDPFHIYQRDYNGSYNISGDSETQTVADSGCGPAAAASLLRMYGKNGDMNNAVHYALNNNYKEIDGGTYPAYFNDYLNKNGINTNSNADNSDVINSLIQNKPVILMGQDYSNSGRTPYGSKYSHYVVARGLDSNGNVIVEDSEDRNGSTRYNLVDTLNNSSIKITTGIGKYGRGENNGVITKYIDGVNAVTNSSVLNIIGNVSGNMKGIDSASTSKSNNKSSDTNNKSSTINASTNGTEGNLTPDTDVKTKCGYTADQLLSAIKSIHPEGCSAEQFPEAAIAVENSRGINALFVVAAAVQEHGWNGVVGINTTGGNYGNWNVFNIEGSPNSSNGRWKDYTDLTNAFEGFADLIMGDSYYGAGLTTPAKIGNRYCPPNASENANYSPWGEVVCQVASNIVNHIPTGAGRGKIKSGLNKKLLNNVSNSISYHTAKAILSGRGGLPNLTSYFTPESKNAQYFKTPTTSKAEDLASKWTVSTSDSTENDTTNQQVADVVSNVNNTTSENTSSSSNDSSSLISKLTNYSVKLSKGVYGSDFYDALYGNTNDTSTSLSSSVGSSGDAAKMLGKQLTLERNNGKGSISKTVAITEDEIDLYDMLTSECGLNSAVACGILANWEEENGINSIKQVATKGIISGGGGGLMQWTDSGNGNPHLNWIKDHPEYSSDPWSWEANKAHAKEVINSNSGGNWNNCINADPSLSSKGFTACGSMDEFKKLTKAEDAAVNYERAFEVSWNWNGEPSENVGKLPDNQLYDNVRALIAKILYELIVNGKSDGTSAAGRGRRFSIHNLLNRKSKFGRATSDTPATTTAPTTSGSTSTTTTTTAPTTSGSNTTTTVGGITNQSGSTTTTDQTGKNDNNKSSTTETITPAIAEKREKERQAAQEKLQSALSSSLKSKINSNTEQLFSKTKEMAKNNIKSSDYINKLTKYSTELTKGVYGIDFYKALYGNSDENSEDSDSETTASYKGNDVIYAAAMVFEALYKADPNLTYDSTGTKYNDLVCRDGTKLEHERPDCSGMMSAVIHYMGYYTGRWGNKENYTDSYHGEGFGTQDWNINNGNTCIYDADGNLSKDWELLPAKTEPKPGDIRFSASHEHTDMFVFYDGGNYPRGFNAGTGDNGGSIGNGMYNSYCLAKYYLDNNELPDPSTVNAERGKNGAGTITDDDTKFILRYKGSSGSGKFGRGRGTKKPNFSALNRIPISKIKRTDSGTISDFIAKEIVNNHVSKSYKTGNGRGKDILKSLDSVRTSTNNNGINTLQSTASNSKSINNIGTNSYSNNTSGYNNYSNNNSNNESININQLLQFVSVIANNSDKINSIIELLGVIATNTENNASKTNNTSKNSKNNNGGLAALRNALDTNSSGIDIVKAVYEIARK